MLTGIEQLDEEWRRAQELVIGRCVEMLTDLGMTPEGVQFVVDMKGYPRIPYFIALWVEDPRQRLELGAAACIHCIGIKLLDDLLDADQPLSRWDQILGVYLMQSSAATMGRYENAGATLQVFAEDYRTIWRLQLEEMRERPAALQPWIRFASVKSGLLLATYAASACLAAGVPAAVEVAREFAIAYGVLFMIGDDLRDHVALGEEGGNLAHLVLTGRVDAAELIAEIRRWQDRACRALEARPVVYDLRAFIRAFSDHLAAIVERLGAAAAVSRPSP